jgi:hypothetical protein
MRFRTVVVLILTTAASLIVSVGFVEFVGRVSNPATAQILAMIVLWMFTYLLPLLVVGYAIYKSLRQQRSRQERLVLIVASYFSVILVSAGLYYSISLAEDHNYAVRQYFHYQYEGNLFRSNLSRVIHRSTDTERAFNGIEARLYSCVEDSEIPAEYRLRDDPPEKYWIEAAQRPLEQVVRFQPAARLAVFGDCLHFSVMTMTTVGLGDISPRLWYTKLASDIQALTGVSLFVVALGMLFGNWTTSDPQRSSAG